MRHLDRILDAGHARKLGVDDFPYAAWSPTLRLLLADRTPLQDLAALRRAVASVAWDKASPAEAARDYRRSVWPRLWGVGMPEAAAPDEVINALAYATTFDCRGAVVLAHEDADQS